MIHIPFLTALGVDGCRTPINAIKIISHHHIPFHHHHPIPSHRHDCHVTPSRNDANARPSHHHHAFPPPPLFTTTTSFHHDMSKCNRHAKRRHDTTRRRPPPLHTTTTHQNVTTTRNNTKTTHHGANRQRTRLDTQRKGQERTEADVQGTPALFSFISF